MQAARNLHYPRVWNLFSVLLRKACSFILKHTVSMPVQTTVAYTCAARKFHSLKTYKKTNKHMSFYVERDGARIQGNRPHSGVKLGAKFNSALAKPATSACRNTVGLFAG
eukprot:jgi/Botrbrau1/20196/Bobra.0547s0002.2